MCSALAMAGHGWPQEQIPELVDLHAMHIHSFRELPLGHWLLAKLSKLVWVDAAVEIWVSLKMI